MKGNDKNPFKGFSVDTPVGIFSMILDHQDVIRAGFVTIEEYEIELKKPIEKIKDHPYSTQVKNWLTGNSKTFDTIPYKIGGTEFQKKLWTWLKYNTQPGETYPYNKVAAAIGHPGASRAVGTACKQNPLVLIIPCPRIIKANGKLGKYRYGQEVKQFILNNEKER